jgi:hypothetical protein
MKSRQVASFWGQLLLKVFRLAVLASTLRGFAAPPCGKASPFRGGLQISFIG